MEAMRNGKKLHWHDLNPRKLISVLTFVICSPFFYWIYAVREEGFLVSAIATFAFWWTAGLALLFLVGAVLVFAHLFQLSWPRLRPIISWFFR